MLQTAPAWLVNLALYWFGVRPVLQFVSFYNLNAIPQYACSSLPPSAMCADLKSRFYSPSKLLIKVMKSARTDKTPVELRTKDLSLSLYFDSKLPVTIEPCFQSVWYFHLTMFLFLAYKKLCLWKSRYMAFTASPCQHGKDYLIQWWNQMFWCSLFFREAWFFLSVLMNNGLTNFSSIFSGTEINWALSNALTFL